MKRKHVAILLAAAMCLSACGSTAQNEPVQETAEVTEDTVVEDAADVETTSDDVKEEDQAATSEDEAEENSSEKTSELAAVEDLMTRVDLSRYDSIGYAFGGLVPVQKDEKWGAANYAGEEVIPCEYDNFRSPNNAGYIILYKGDSQKDLFDKEGNLIATTEESIKASSSGYVITKSHLDDDGIFHLIYEFYDYDGNMTASFGSDSLDEPVIDNAHGFYEGKSIITGNIKKTVFYRDDIYNGVMPFDFGLVDDKGNVTWIDGDGVDEDDTSKFMSYEEGMAAQEADAETHPGIGLAGMITEVETAISSMNHGYFLTAGMHIEGNYLRDENGLVAALQPWYMKINGDSLEYTTLDKDEMGRKVTMYTGDFYDDYDASLRGYYYDGDYFYNYGPKFLYRSEEKYALIDPSGGSLDYKIFDYCEMSENEYWLVEKDGKQGYCDHDGNIVNMYEGAGAFAGNYAFILENGNGYLINEKFEKLADAGPAECALSCGELIGVKEGDTYKYYCAK